MKFMTAVDEPPLSHSSPVAAVKHLCAVSPAIKLAFPIICGDSPCDPRLQCRQTSISCRAASSATNEANSLQQRIIPQPKITYSTQYSDSS